jgi:hypothetical protein
VNLSRPQYIFGDQRPKVRFDQLSKPGTELADAVNWAGQTVARVAGEMAQKDQNDRDRMDAINAANAVSEKENQYGQAQSDIVEQVQNGSIQWTDMPQKWQEAKESIGQPDFSNISSPITRMASNQSWGLTSGKLDAVFDASMNSLKKESTWNEFSSGPLENELQNSTQPGYDLVQGDRRMMAYLPVYQFRFGLAEGLKRNQRDRQRIAGNDVEGQIDRAAENPAVLNQIKRNLTDPKARGNYVNKLQPENKLVQLRRIDGLLAQNARRAALDDAKGISDADKLLDEYDRILMDGRTPSPELASGVGSVLKQFPSLQKKFDETVTKRDALNVLMSQKPDEALRSMAALQNETYQSADPQIIARNNQILKGAASLMKMRDDDPLTYYENTTGIMMPRVDFMNAIQNPDVEREKSAQNISYLRAARKLNPAVNLYPLRADQAPGEIQYMANLAPNEKLDFLKARKSFFHDDEVFASYLKQIGAQDSNIAYAAKLAEAGNRDTAIQVLKGSEALASKKIPMPKDKDSLQKFNSRMNDVYAMRPGVRDKDYKAVQAAYAGMSIDEGDYSGNFNDSRMKKATRSVVGEPVKIHGVSVLPPYGVDEDVFENNLRNQVNALDRQYQGWDKGNRKINYSWGGLTFLQVGNDAYIPMIGNRYWMPDGKNYVTLKGSEMSAEAMANQKAFVDEAAKNAREAMKRLTENEVKE